MRGLGSRLFRGSRIIVARRRVRLRHRGRNRNVIGMHQPRAMLRRGFHSSGEDEGHGQGKEKADDPLHRSRIGARAGPVNSRPHSTRSR